MIYRAEVQGAQKLLQHFHGKEWAHKRRDRLAARSEQAGTTNTN